MDRLCLLTPALLLLLSTACSRENPAFGDAPGTSGDGDGDGTPGDGDGTPGDGDGAPGDGDGDGTPGDGDGTPGDGDGDGEPGDGDGEPGLPTCPDAAWVDVELIEDTFLDGSYFPGPGCLIDWDFMQMAGVPGPGQVCNGLDFGGADGHWVCGNAGCNSAWLGRFALEEWVGVGAQVLEAGLSFAAHIEPGTNTAKAYELSVDGIDFGDCLTWMAGEGVGTPPAACVSTQLYAAFPHVWGLAIDAIPQQLPIAIHQVPSMNVPAEYMFAMPLEKPLVQSWLDGQVELHGIVLRTIAATPAQFYLRAQDSGHDPLLQIRLCMP